MVLAHAPVQPPSVCSSGGAYPRPASTLDVGAGRVHFETTFLPVSVTRSNPPYPLCDDLPVFNIPSHIFQGIIIPYCVEKGAEAPTTNDHALSRFCIIPDNIPMDPR